MNFKQGDKVEAINDSGNVQYVGLYLGEGYPGKNIPVKDHSKSHYAIQVNDAGDAVYLETYYWTLRKKL